MTQSTAWDRDTFVHLTGYREVEEVFRRSRDFVISGTKAGSDEFVHGTLVALDGREHMGRRRALMKMISSDQPWGAEGTLIDDIFARYLAEVVAAVEPRDGHVRFDLIPVGRRIIWRLTAAFVGLDNIDDPAQVERFMGLVEPVLEGLTLEYQPEERHEAILVAARKNRALIREEMFDPSLARRQVLVEKVRRGEAKAEDLPGDLITSMLSQSDEPDLELIFREMIALLAAAVNNPVSQMAWALDDATPWLDEHPEYRAKVTDKEFLGRMVKETMRLHRSSRPHVVRIAVKDTVLESSGREVPQGTWVSLWLQAANRDTTIFGDDADEFDPFRQPLDPSVQPFGIGLGSGAHVCLGRPLLLWDQGDEDAQGLLVKLLRFLLTAGVRPDPDGEQHEGGPEGGRRHDRYDVVMPVAARNP
ncbi:cytochrome P450 [Pseudonocardia kujensis]|uniref:cytochrome P450 n=1 Tax=Pseudonocardia kujensis TaxID=1128675 RepID=UPI001E459995|nr:cytochrome P450 [Pseudonocardia kujensis]MCE0763540.1 cytochrome P450 [Pseudonocardia kujensis]